MRSNLCIVWECSTCGVCVCVCYVGCMIFEQAMCVACVVHVLFVYDVSGV